MFGKNQELLMEWMDMQHKQNMKLLELIKLTNEKIDKLAEACGMEWQEASFVKKANK